MLKETILESIYLDREQSKLAERSQYEKEVCYTVKKQVMKKNLEISLIKYTTRD